MVRFTLFGVPVEIKPWFWLGAVFFSGALYNLNPAGLQYSLIFILAATVSILVHEFGHALTGRRLGGGYATIELWALGGLAYNHGGRFTRSSRFWMIAAGPGAGFALGALVYLVLMLMFGPSDSARLTGLWLFGIDAAVSPDTYDFFQSRKPLMWLFESMLLVNFWWGLFNLLPIPPLDGGQISQLFVKPKKKAYQIAVGTAIAAGLIGFLWRESLFMPMFFGYLAWMNYQQMKENHWQ